jgi:hypothetical protein
VCFSGIDGAGKGTQIQALCPEMSKEGRRVRVIRFWDDIARLTNLREATGHRIFKGDKGIGSPSAPINRRDKNAGSWPMTMVRLFIYFIDALSTLSASDEKLPETELDRLPSWNSGLAKRLQWQRWKWSSPQGKPL